MKNKHGIQVEHLHFTDVIVIDSVPADTTTVKAVTTPPAHMAQCISLTTVDTARRLLRYHTLASAKSTVLNQVSGLEQQVNAINAELDVYAHDLRSSLYINEEISQ